jgi:hypothetical protein
MGKKYLDTKEGSLEQSVLGVWQTAIEEGEARVDGRTKQYKEHRAKLEAARLRKEKLTKKQKQLDVDGDGEIEGSDLAKLRKKAKKEETKLGEIGPAAAAAVGAVAGKIMSGKKHKKIKKEEVEEALEWGTDELRKHTEDVTPGQDGEWVEAVNAKNKTMREALAQVWNVDEGKSPFKKEDKKGDKTLTGKKVASVDINPTIKEKTK